MIKVFCFFFPKKKAFLFLFMLTGCDLAPHYQVPITKIPIAYKEAPQFLPAKPQDSEPRGAWWTVFGDPVLNQLEDKVDDANPTLEASLASRDEARAVVKEARSGLFPHLQVGGYINTDRESNNRPLRGRGEPNEYLDNAVDTEARYEVDLWDHVANTIKQSQAAAQASAADVESVRLSLHAELASDYIRLRGIDVQTENLRNAVQSYGDALRLTQNRFAGKIASGLDVSRAQNQLAGAQAALTDIDAQRSVAEHAIAVLIGKLPAACNIASSGWRLQPAALTAPIPSALLERRPDVASAERQMAAANAAIGVARAAFYPTLSMNLLYGLQDTGFNIFSLPNDFWAVGPGLAMPLFEGGLRHAQENAALAAYRLKAANYRATVLGAFQDVEDALAERRQLAQEATEQSTALQAAQRVLAIDMNLYKDGAANFLDVAIAQTEELRSEQIAADVRTRQALADVALIRAIGGGWHNTEIAASK